MGLLTVLLTLPYQPVRAVTAVASVILQQAEQELYGSAGVRRQLEALDDAVARGELSEADRQTAEEEILARLTSYSTG
ncbi:hypothetical protein GCM10010399_82920 [Dactylosporangium fulvum]|uniref:Gas vesicle protein GvpG n=1 Tax=Dactylosporangium fulvum TaxID=53359 RepID=A0ABY5VNI5_9ACTN|nr:gas vesicle protein GvpG [Dactylosporangium fulvum]UWP79277.1 gas vesicle protein GvpG [Dactylosporangium fulvum]